MVAQRAAIQWNSMHQGGRSVGDSRRGNLRPACSGSMSVPDPSSAAVLPDCASLVPFRSSVTDCRGQVHPAAPERHYERPLLDYQWPHFEPRPPLSCIRASGCAVSASGWHPAWALEQSISIVNSSLALHLVAGSDSGKPRAAAFPCSVALFR
jgi:hypothetical protein